MKKFCYRFLIVVLSVGMLTPSWLSKILAPTKAEAAIIDVINEGFSGNPTPDVPTGWTFSGITGVYNSTGNYGVDKPSLKFDNSDDMVTTKSFANADSLSFWVKGQGTDTTSSLLIEYYKNSVWSALATLNPIPTTGTTENYSLIPNTNQLRFTYTKSVGNLAFDDVLVTFDDSALPVIAPHTDVTAEATSSAGAIVNYITPIASDNIDADTPATCLPASGTLFPIGTTLVTCNKTDSDGNAAIPTSFNIIVEDTISPSDSVSINAGDQYTNNPTVVLTLDASDAVGVSDMRFSNDGITFSDWEGFTTTKSWDLSVGDGLKTVYVEYRDAAKNISDTFNDTIILDTTAPAIAGVSDGETYDAAKTITATDDNGIASITLNGNPFVTGTTVSANGSYQLIATDNAGNTTEINFVIDIAPQISGESVVSVGESSVTITWTTDQPSTSRVVYDTVSHSSLASDANYGYAFSTVEYIGKVTSHSVAITGLTSGTTYFFRTISHGSPEVVSNEKSFTTAQKKVVTTVATTIPSAPEVTTEPAAPRFIANIPIATAPVEQGQIKGAETTDNQESEKINWTPWIILFILIVLAGAATGGYFYWFGRDDDEEILTKEVIEKSKKPSANKSEKPAVKKSRRW